MKEFKKYVVPLRESVVGVNRRETYIIISLWSYTSEKVIIRCIGNTPLKYEYYLVLAEAIVAKQ